MKYRVEQLATTCGVSVDTIRFYQSKGLLQAPAREGRVAVYGREHVERIRKIRSLQKKGITLAAISRIVSGRLARGDQDLAAAVAQAEARFEDEAISLEELAQRCGVPAPLLASIERGGLPLGRVVDGETLYTGSDVSLVRTGLRLLELGLPLADLLDMAQRQNESARAIAEDAVRLFDKYIRDPIKESAVTEEDAAARLVDAFQEMLPAVTELVAGHFRRVLLAVAQERIDSGASA